MFTADASDDWGMPLAATDGPRGAVGHQLTVQLGVHLEVDGPVHEEMQLLRHHAPHPVQRRQHVGVGPQRLPCLASVRRKLRAGWQAGRQAGWLSWLVELAG